MYAQDKQHRHVAIKLVKDGSQEYHALRLLSQDSGLKSVETFNGVLPPVDFLQLHDYWFVVMPRSSF